MKLKRKNDRYKLSIFFQYLTYLVLGVLIVLVVMKTVRIGEKIISVQEAVALYDKKQWLEAEEALQKAKKNDWFLYQQKEIDTLLIELNWITEYRSQLEDLMAKMDESLTTLDYESFMENLDTYDGLGLEALEEWQTAYLLDKYPIETVIHYCWRDFKEDMVRMLSDPLNNGDYEWAKEKILEVPEAYFENDKHREIENLFVTCDHQLIEDMKERCLNFEAAVSFVNQIYYLNSCCDFDSYWLNETVSLYLEEKLAQLAVSVDEETLNEVRKGNEAYSESRNVLMAASVEALETEENSETGNTIENTNIAGKLKEHQKQIKEFVKAVINYRSQQNRPYYNPAIEEFVTTYIQEQEEIIKLLCNYRYYDEAINYYKEMDYFKHYEEEIKQIENTKEYVAPWTILGSITDYPIYQTGEGIGGGAKYILAFNDVTEEVELCLIEGTQEEHTIHKISVKFSDINLPSAILKHISMIYIQENRIAFKICKDDKEYVWILKLQEDTLRLLFEKQGEQIDWTEDLLTITVLNPTDEAIPNTYTYLYGDEGYTKDDIQPIMIDLNSEDLLTFIGRSVMFTCYVPEIDEGNPATGYAYEEGTYDQNKFAQIFTEDGVVITSGFYQIVGEITGTITYFDTTMQMDVIRPIVRVTQLEKQEGIE